MSIVKVSFLIISTITHSWYNYFLYIFSQLDMWNNSFSQSCISPVRSQISLGLLLPLVLHLDLALPRGVVGAAAEAGQGAAHHAHLAVVFPHNLRVTRRLCLFSASVNPA